MSKLLTLWESFESSRKGIAEEKGGINLNKMPRGLPIVISASRRIKLESPPYSQNTRLKAYREAYGASSTVRLYPASVRAETKSFLPDRYASITFL